MFSLILSEFFNSVVFITKLSYIFIIIFILFEFIIFEFEIFEKIDKLLHPKKYILINKNSKKYAILMKRINVYVNNIEKYEKRFIFLYNNRYNLDNYYTVDLYNIFDNFNFTKYSFLCKLKDGDIKHLIKIDTSKYIYRYKFKENKYLDKDGFQLVSLIKN